MKSWKIGRVGLGLLLCTSAIVGRGETDKVTTIIPLTGVASGGILEFSKGCNWRSAYVSIETHAGETPESVAQRLGEAGGSVIQVVSVQSNKLEVAGTIEQLFMGGTEIGLGIPAAPHSFTVNYDLNADTAHLCWANAPNGYDLVALAHPLGTLMLLSGSPTNTIMTDISGGDEAFKSENDFMIIGKRAGVPSNVTRIRVRMGYQDEMLDAPFTSNIMPNWMSWNRNSDTGTVQCVEGHKTDVQWNPKVQPENPSRKYFYQLVKGTGAGFQGGIWRKFLGLTPGHTYKVSVRLNTLAMSGSNGDWWYSAHVAHNGTTAADLTSDQLAGTAALPDGTQGPTAGQFARYGGSTTTSGQWTERSSGTDGPGKVVGNITLPEGVTIITVWVKHGSNTGDSTGVGIDWVALEDLTVTGQ